MSPELKSEVRDKTRWKGVWDLTKTTFTEYFAEDTFRHAAALAYYAIFSLIPMIYLGVYFFGRFLGNDTVQGMVEEFLIGTIGMQDISGIMEVLSMYDVEKRNPVMEVVGIVVLLFSSSAFVVSLRKSISDFLDVEEVKQPVKKMIIQTIVSRLLAIAFIGGFGVIIIVVYIAQTVLISISKDMISDPTFNWIFNNGVAHVTAIGSNFLLFTLMFKYIHDGKVRWKPAMLGALITAVLVYAGQILIKFYLTNFFLVADGGVVGSLFVVLTWIFYTSQILFLGAKFVKIYSLKLGYTITSRFITVVREDGEEKVILKEEKLPSDEVIPNNH